jgi:hypothetical protein
VEEDDVPEEDVPEEDVLEVVKDGVMVVGQTSVVVQTVTVLSCEGEVMDVVLLGGHGLGYG